MKKIRVDSDTKAWLLTAMVYLVGLICLTRYPVVSGIILSIDFVVHLGLGVLSFRISVPKFDVFHKSTDEERKEAEES